MIVIKKMNKPVDMVNFLHLMFIGDWLQDMEMIEFLRYKNNE